jgi:hypothetical protein
VLVEVIAAIGKHDAGLGPGAAGLAGDRASAELVQQRDELGDVVAVAAGQGHGQRDAGGVDDQVVL